jgi:hypothetical protein
MCFNVAASELRQGIACKPSSSVVLEQSSTLYGGLRAGVGYSAEEMGSTLTSELKSPRLAPSRAISTAKSYQLAVPLSVQ